MLQLVNGLVSGLVNGLVGGLDTWPIGNDFYSQGVREMHRQDNATYTAYLHMLPDGIRPAPDNRVLIESATAWAKEVMNHTDMRKLLGVVGTLKHRIRTVRAFRAAHLRGSGTALSVFYPFSGFDLPTALALFPNASRLTMVAGLSVGDPACFLVSACRSHLAVVAMMTIRHWAHHEYAWTETHFMERVLHTSKCCENLAFAGSPPLRPGIIGLLILGSVFMGHRLRELELRPGGHLRMVTDLVAIDYFSVAIATDTAVQEVQLEKLRVRVFDGRPVATLIKAAGAGGGYVWLPTRPVFSRWVLNNSYAVVQDETGLSPAAFDPVAFGPPNRTRRRPAETGATVWRVKTFGNLSQLEFGHYPCLGIVPHWRPGRLLSAFAKSLAIRGDDIDSIGSALDRAYADSPNLPFRWGYATAPNSCLRRWRVESNQRGGGVLLSAWRR